MVFSAAGGLAEIVRALAERLPPGWSVERVVDDACQARGVEVDATLRLTSSEGRARCVPVLLKRRLDPRGACELPVLPDVLVVAPYLSSAVRELLTSRGVSYADQTGNARLVVDAPGLFVLTSGATSNPWPDARALSLRGVKAGRVVQTLVAQRMPVGVRELATLAQADPGYVSRLLKHMDREALIERTSRGQVERVDWRAVLVRWSSDAPLDARVNITAWLAPRGIRHALERLAQSSLRHLITGSEAAARCAPIAPTRLLSVYVDDPQHAAQTLDLRQVDAGANVLLLQPEDEALYAQGVPDDGVCLAPLPLLVADLLTGPGRAPAEAEALMRWMATHEEVWRG